MKTVANICSNYDVIQYLVNILYFQIPECEEKNPRKSKLKKKYGDIKEEESQLIMKYF